MTLNLAGHWFENGVCIRPVESGERKDQRCGRCLVDLAWVKRSDSGQTGIAHVGTATTAEAAELEDYFITLRKAIDDAMNAVAAGAGRR